MRDLCAICCGQIPTTGSFHVKCLFKGLLGVDGEFHQEVLAILLDKIFPSNSIITMVSSLSQEPINL